nr:SCO family protein [Acidobacteriota bacterium]
DIRLGIVEAADEKIGSAIDHVMLLCYHYDPTTGKYGTTVITMVRIGAVMTMIGFAAFLFASVRRDRASRHQAAAAANRI